MGAFGRERVERCLSWDHSVSNLLAAYERTFEKMGRIRLTAPINENFNPGVSTIPVIKDQERVQIGSDGVEG